MIDCNACGIKHVELIDCDRNTSDFYEEKFYDEEKPDYIKDVEEDLDWWMATYNNYFDILEKTTKGRRLLDIGSGPGYFLKCAKDRGWDELGFEPSSVAHKYSSSLGVKVVNDFFKIEESKKIGKFDVISLNLVLEHIENPVDFVNGLKKFLNPGGVMYIFSPNDYNPLQKILTTKLGFKPWWVAPTHHVNYFDFKSIKKFLKKLDFEIIDLLATFPMEFFLLEGENYVGNREVGRRCHLRRKNFDLNLLKSNPNLLNTIYRDFAKQGIGREFVAIAKVKKA